MLHCTLRLNKYTFVKTHISFISSFAISFDRLKVQYMSTFYGDLKGHI